ncbi:DUF2232 domain-containing protein [Nodosilinea sp. LEGE 06152]|uniref:DUF2232 domain-containing protein n=1 Tax=Nodosilinea sp. LEGE 06152 TaxID=2777966 RepID=UPI00187F87F2|nr:DUF2232 domain-containing protein [Nodosilinea sp. LEGE 06152]MBE9159609.1 DUF2232 domain-containing protein [Nodosilinea sp. LEGE 06152]
MSHPPDPTPGANFVPPAEATASDFDGLDTYLEYRTPEAETDGPDLSHRLKAGPLAMVETAFLASTAALIWLVNTYFPPGPILRILFPLPMALVYLRWGPRAAWMSALVSGLLLSVLMGPPRSLLFLIPYALLGVQLGFFWVRRANWYISIAVGSLLGTIGFFFRLWLSSVLVGEDLWVYLTTQVTQMLNWGLERLVGLGVLDVGVLGQANVQAVQILALVSVLASNVVYLFTVHLAAWLLLGRLGAKIPEPPGWVQDLLKE